MDESLSNLVDQRRIVAIDAGIFPEPPGSPSPGDHLLVNCHYDVSMAGIPPQEMLVEARSDALKIVRCLAAQHRCADIISIVVTVYAHIPVAGAARPARRRVYRVNVFSRDIPSNPLSVTEDFFSRVAAFESSELNDVAELLHQTTS